MNQKINIKSVQIPNLWSKCIGSTSEQMTLDTPSSGDDWKAELICRLISGLYGSGFGQERSFANHFRFGDVGSVVASKGSTLLTLI